MASKHNPERSQYKGRSYRKGGQMIRSLKEDQMDEDMDSVQVHEDDAYEMDGPGYDDEDLGDEDGDEDEDFDDSMDGDHESALASAGFGTDEDYGSFDDYDDF